MMMTSGARRRAGLRTWMVRLALGLVLSGAATAAIADAQAQEAQQPPPQSAQQPSVRPPAAQDEFVPISEVPEHDKLPAAPFLIGAYVFAWVALLFYVWSLWRRLSRVEEELKRVARGDAKS
jgi:CcmD family protein